MAPIELKKPKEQFDEQKAVDDWRRELFRGIMTKTGATDVMADDIEALVRSSATWEQVKTLREKGCSPDLIVKILT